MSGGLQFQQRGIHEVTRFSAKSLLQSLPPNLALAVWRIGLGEARVVPQLDADRRRSRLVDWQTSRLRGQGRKRVVRFIRHPVVLLLANDCLRDRSHLRSASASVVQSPDLKFPFFSPRGAPGLRAAMEAAALSASDGWP